MRPVAAYVLGSELDQFKDGGAGNDNEERAFFDQINAVLMIQNRAQKPSRNAGKVGCF